MSIAPASAGHLPAQSRLLPWAGNQMMPPCSPSQAPAATPAPADSNRVGQHAWFAGPAGPAAQLSAGGMTQGKASTQVYPASSSSSPGAHLLHLLARHDVRACSHALQCSLELLGQHVLILTRQPDEWAGTVSVHSSGRQAAHPNFACHQTGPQATHALPHQQAPGCSASAPA